MQKNLRKRTGAKLPLVLLSIFLFLLLFAPAASAATYGDINDDGEINVQDVVLVMKHVLELETLTEAQKAVADVNGDGNINVQDVTLIMQYALGLIDDFPHAALTVSSVTAVNPKQVEVEFNRMLNSEEKAEMTTANFHVGLQATPLVDRLTGAGSAVAVEEDGKTALLTMADGYYFVNSSTTNRVVVKSAVGISTDHVVTDLAFIDADVPTLESVKTISPRKIVMTFSEPLDNITPTNITLDGGAVALNLAGATFVDARRELIVESFSDLTEGTHTLAILSGTNLKDYSGFSVAPTSKTFTHTPITTPPTVSVKSATESTVTLEFSRAIDKTTLIGNTSVLFRHTYDTTLNQVTGTSVTNPSGDSRTFVVDFGSKLLPPGSTTVWMKYADGTLDANKIKDTWGNIIPPATLTANVEPDTVAPTATVTVYSNTQIDVQYSEEVTGAATLANYSLKKGTTSVALSSVTDLTGNKYRLTSASAMQGDYTLTISNIKDTSPAENAMNTQTYDINVPDTIAPTVSSVMANHATLISANKIYIYYSEEMGSSALESSNYRLVNSLGTNQYLLPAGTSITQTATTVIITLPDDLGTLKTNYGSTTDLTKLYIGSVTDLAGNTVNPMGIRPISPAAKFDASPTNVSVLSTSQVSFVVERHLQSATAASIRRTTGPVNASSISFVNNVDGTATITATFPAGTFTTNLTGQSINIEEDALTDLFGFTNDDTYKVGGTDITITIDMAAPVLLGAKTLDGDKNGKIDIIALEYSEAIYPGSVSESDYSVQGYTIDTVLVSGTAVGIFVQENVTPDTGATPQVTQVGSIQDFLLTGRNTLGPQTAITPVDEAKPVMISAVTKSATTIEITYSENVTNNNVDPTQYVSSVGGVVSSVSATGNKVTLTLAGVLTSGMSYPAATITYNESGTPSDHTKDTATVPNDAVDGQILTGISSGF